MKLVAAAALLGLFLVCAFGGVSVEGRTIHKLDLKESGKSECERENSIQLMSSSSWRLRAWREDIFQLQ